MKSKFYYLMAFVVLLASCSSPKYTYNFDHYNYQSGKNKKAVASEEKIAEPTVAPVIDETLVASTDDKVYATASKTAIASTEVKKTYLQMDKTQRKELRKLIKSEIKNYVKAKKDHVEAAKQTHAMDHDLKLAAIFGAVGIVALIISGDVFYILGGIALIIGVVFFIKWLVRQ